MEANNDYFASLEKIANEILMEDNPEPMTEDPAPKVPPEEVEALQAANSEPSSAAATEEQLPASPDETEDLQEAIQSAEAEYQAAQEQLASVYENYEEFLHKTAKPTVLDPLPHMGAFAKLIEFSSNPDMDPSLHKVATERLQTAFSNEDEFQNVMTKTANELFSNSQNLKDLYTEDGMNFIADTLVSFADGDISKEAFEVGAVLGKTVDAIKEFGSATKNFWKLRKELGLAKEEAELAFQKAKELNDTVQSQGPLATQEQGIEAYEAMKDATKLKFNAEDIQDRVNMGATGWALGGAGAAGGALYGGKKLYDATHPGTEELEDDPMKTASNNNLNTYELSKGGNKMTVVKDFLKIAGAAGLLNISNDESMDMNIRKEAADQFNEIARMGRKDMDESFMKVAAALYNENQLHEIVAGKHTNELLDKVAFFLDAYEAPADALEKVAGADGVAAKGVGGALTDAKKNIEEHIDKDKKETEQGPAGQTPGSVKPQDTSGYSVIKNPEKYDVDKTAMLEQAFMQKQAAVQAYNEAEEYIRSVVQ